MKPVDGVVICDDWLNGAELQTLLTLLEADGGKAMVSGGAVRNSLMGMSVADVDVATTLLPEIVMERMSAGGHKAIPTGIDHGTITCVIDSVPFEVTTLREDIETDGRHAVVKFGTDWERDANRRDLTINGLYCDKNGAVYDFVDGIKDIQSGTVKFIGDASTRVQEDALRILRFFRFFAWYGSFRPDAAGLKACNANRGLLKNLSAERVWAELKKLLSAPDPSRALLWMRTANVLAEILPESAKWGIDAIPLLIETEKRLGWEADYLLRLGAMMRPHQETVEAVADRLLLSNADKDRLVKWSNSVSLTPDVSSDDIGKTLYLGDQRGIIAATKLDLVARLLRNDDTGAQKLEAIVKTAEEWTQPVFPVSGKDLLELGHQAGPEMGEQLSALEDNWVESNFTLSLEELLASLT